MNLEKSITERKEKDVTFRLIRNIGCGPYHTLNGKSKSSSTKKFLGTHIDNYIRWVEYQFTAKMIWSKFEIDHVRSIFSFDVCYIEETKEAFWWKNIQRSVNQDNNQRGT